ncbi:hypothetical protein BU16DRAFT_526153 [Lophium mytilinum]|uniref:Uncharacterized protein n=1 Tax=Lophium mytilinum TaxID=390894 RepID=A0A6A6QZT5_9PEZI|nr:hypothetical protein BU16DRAFT_526153 [Lophium mytilinum]
MSKLTTRPDYDGYLDTYFDDNYDNYARPSFRCGTHHLMKWRNDLARSTQRETTPSRARLFWPSVAVCMFGILLITSLTILLWILLSKIFRRRPTPEEKPMFDSASHKHSPLLFAESEAAEQEVDETHSPTRSTRISILNPELDDAWIMVL